MDMSRLLICRVLSATNDVYIISVAAAASAAAAIAGIIIGVQYSGPATRHRFTCPKFDHKAVQISSNLRGECLPFQKGENAVEDGESVDEKENGTNNDIVIANKLNDVSRIAVCDTVDARKDILCRGEDENIMMMMSKKS